MKQLTHDQEQGLFQTPEYTYYRSSNPHAIPIIFISGLFAGDWIWDATIPYIREEHRSFVVLREPLASIGATIEVLCHHIKTVLDKLNIHQAILVGNSYGGLLALEIAAKFPERVKSIVVSGSPGLGNPGRLSIGVLGVPRTVNREFALKIAQQLFYDPNAITEDMLNRTLDTFSNNTTILNMLRLLKAERKYDARTLLPLIECNTLLLWGENDVVTPLLDWEQNRSLLKKGSLQVVAACGHTVMIEQPSHFRRHLLAFIATTESREG